MKYNKQMRTIKTVFFAIGLLLVFSCTGNQILTPKNAMDKFEEFKKKEKFIEDLEIFYPGLADPTLQPILTEKINLSAEDFKIIAAKRNATEKDYQKVIKNGLRRFDYLALDTEERERVCTYYEELMDIIGLKSSEGALNNFLY